MMRLIAVELRRALHRRANRVIVLLLAALFLIIGAIGLIHLGNLPPVRTITQADGVVTFSNSEMSGTVQVTGNQAHFSGTFTGGKHARPDDPKPPVETNTDELAPGEKVLLEGAPGHQIVAEGHPSPSLARFTDFFDHLSADASILNVPGGLVVFAALLAGATMVGADWKWNTFSVLLTWEPRRLRLMTARFATVFVVSTVAAFVLIAFFAACTVPTVLAHGTFAGADSTWWTFALEAVGRICVLAGLAAVGGAAVAMIGRNTVAAIVSSMLWLVVLEHIVLALRPSWWAIAYGRTMPVLFSWKRSEIAPNVFVGPGGAAAALGVSIGVLIVLAAVLFTRRDVASS